MRKKSYLNILTISLSLLFIPKISAQEFRYGVEGGANITSITDGAAGMGLQIGGFIEMPILDHLVFQPTALIVWKSAAKDRLSARETLSTLSVEIPALFALPIALTDELLIAPQIGPYIGFGIKGTQTLKNGDLSRSQDAFTTLKYQRLQYGISMGGYVRLQKHFQAGVLYDHPFSAWRKAETRDGLLYLAEQKMSSVRISVAYLF